MKGMSDQVASINEERFLAMFVNSFRDVISLYPELLSLWGDQAVTPQVSRIHHEASNTHVSI